MRNASLEIKVGVFVVIGFALLLFFAVASNTIGGFGSVKKTMTLIYETNDASSIYKKADVFYKGVKVGFVKEINLHYDYVDLELDIYKEYKIPNNITIGIYPDSVLGTKVVYISSMPEVSTGFIKDGDRFSNVQNNTKNYDIAALIMMVGTLTDNTQELLGEVADLAQSTTGLIQNINESVLNEERLDSLFYIVNNLGTISDGLLTTINEVNTYFDDESRRNLHNSIQNVNLFTERLLSNESLLTTLVTDKTLAKNLTETINAISRTSQNIISTKYNFNFDLYGYYNFEEEIGDYSLHGGVDIINQDDTSIISLGLARIPFYNIRGDNTTNYIFGGPLGIDILYGRPFFNNSLILKLGLINSVGGIKGSYRVADSLDFHSTIFLESLSNISFNYGVNYYFERLFLTTGVFIDSRLDAPSYFFGGGVSMGDNGIRRGIEQKGLED